MLVRMHRNWISHTWLVGILHCIVTLENWKFAKKTKTKAKHVFPIQLSNHTPGHLFQRNEKFCQHHWYMNVHSSLIHHCQKLEINQMSFNG